MRSLKSNGASGLVVLLAGLVPFKARLLAVLLAAAFVIALIAPSAQADKARYTRGDAEAMLNDYPPGKSIFQRLDEAIGLDIRPIPEFYADVPYCVEDWHVLALLWDDYEYVLEFPDGSQYVRDERDAREFLQAVEMQFFLDGVPVTTSKRPIKPYLNSLAEEFEQFLEDLFGGEAEATVSQGWAVQVGRVLAPDELDVGTHTLEVIATHPDLDFDWLPSPWSGSLEFTVYPAGSDACTAG